MSVLSRRELVRPLGAWDVEHVRCSKIAFDLSFWTRHRNPFGHLRLVNDPGIRIHERRRWGRLV